MTAARAGQFKLSSLVVPALSLVAAVGVAVAVWWYGPWNAVNRYQRMSLLSLHRLAEDEPQNRLAWHTLSLRLAGDGDARLAEPALRHTVELNDSDPQATAALADLLIGTGRSAEAFQLLKAFTVRFPENAGGRLELGRLYLQKGSLHHAAEEFEAVTEHDRSNGTAWLLLAQCYFNMQKSGPSRAALDRAIALRPNDPQVLNLEASLLQASGHPEDALAYARRAAQTAPNDLLLQANLAEILIQFNRGPADLTEAESTIARMEQLSPNYPPLSSLRGDIEAARGHWDAAARFYVKTTEVMPNSNHAFFALARAYRRLGRTAEAARLETLYNRRLALQQKIDSIRTEIGTDPKNADLYGKLSTALMELGRGAEALDALQTAAALAPSSMKYRNRLNKIGRSRPPSNGP